MKKHVIRESKVPFKPHQIYDLVNDTESYPYFVPFCTRGIILQDGPVNRVAELTFGYHGLSQTIKTHNTMVPHQRINIQLIEGPFTELSGCWEFHSLEVSEGCYVRVEFKYEAASGWVAMAFEPIFSQVLGQMISCFSSEAENRYGKV